MRRFICALMLLVCLSNVGCKKEPGVVHVASITLNPALTVVEGETASLSATVVPGNATNKTVSWSTSDASVATVTGGVVSAHAKGTATITATAEDGGHSASCLVTVTPKTILVESVSFYHYVENLQPVIITEAELHVDDEFQLEVVILPDVVSDRTLIWESSDATVASVEDGLIKAIKPGQATITATGVNGGASASFAVTVYAFESGEAVDFGLSVKWSSLNLGANKPEEYGGYYMWAGTRNVADRNINLDWAICPYNKGGESVWTKYNNYNDTVLEPEDDVAHVRLGGGWRMPTSEEWQELVSECTLTWTDNYNGTGVSGMIVTREEYGYIGNSIFLPATGSRIAGLLHGAGDEAHYWSSSLETNQYAFNTAFCLYFGASEGSGVIHDYRCYGLSVRPVIK